MGREHREARDSWWQGVVGHECCWRTSPSPRLNLLPQAISPSSLLRRSLLSQERSGAASPSAITSTWMITSQFFFAPNEHRRPGLAHDRSGGGWPLGVGIDQTLLPHRFQRRTLWNCAQATEPIRAMVVRSAPLIGVTGAYGLMVALQVDSSEHPWGSFRRICRPLWEPATHRCTVVTRRLQSMDC